MAELWAFLAFVTHVGPGGGKLHTDCKNLVQGYTAGRARTTDAFAIYSDVWRRIWHRIDDIGEENISVENRIWRGKVTKLEKLVQLYTELVRPRSEEVEMSGSVEESLCLELMTDIDEIESLMEMVEIAQSWRWIQR